MARFRNKKKVAFVKPAKKQPPQNVDHVTGDKIPRSFVFSRLKLPATLKQLQADLRKVMLPYTALNLKVKREEKKRNNLKDFLNVAGPMGVTHFLMLSKTGTSPYLRVARTPQGPTLTFKIQEYSLAVDIANSQLRPRVPKDLFKNSPLVIHRPGKRVGLGHGSKRVRVKTGQLKKGCFGSGQNGFGSKRVRVETGSGRNGLGSKPKQVWSV
ncbi:putative Brix domain-containing protein [Helianthus annuus]|nr:putative Brix domain-containing protein [Helianthus annuus]